MSFLPKQARYIVGTEACERFSFYGMKSILALYMVSALSFSEERSISTIHLFVAFVYLTPLAGAWLADRYLGRYKTILYISLLYCIGHGILASIDLFDSLETRTAVFYSGLAVIALGAGGIKPCVAAFMGDQITDSSPRMMTRAYSIFYWSINLGSLFSFLIIPWVRDSYGCAWAFAIPGIFMAIATFCFWSGRKTYIVHKASAEQQEQKPNLFRILATAIAHRSFSAAEQHYGKEPVQAIRQTLRILSVFAFVVPFWSLFDQTASSWVIQGEAMTPLHIPLLNGHTWVVGPEQIQSTNPLLVMILVPILTTLVYPYIGKLGHPLVRMTAGIFLAAVSFVVVAWLQYRIEAHESLSIAWQFLPYLILTVGEILLSTTGLEFAYTQAPASAKSLISSFWNLTIFAGNLLVSILTWVMSLAHGTTAISVEGFLTYAGLTAIVSVFFGISAYFYARGSRRAPVHL